MAHKELLMTVQHTSDMYSMPPHFLSSEMEGVVRELFKLKAERLAGKERSDVAIEASFTKPFDWVGEAIEFFWTYSQKTTTTPGSSSSMTTPSYPTKFDTPPQSARFAPQRADPYVSPRQPSTFTAPTSFTPPTATTPRPTYSYNYSPPRPAAPQPPTFNFTPPPASFYPAAHEDSMKSVYRELLDLEEANHTSLDRYFFRSLSAQMVKEGRLASEFDVVAIRESVKYLILFYMRLLIDVQTMFDLVKNHPCGHYKDMTKEQFQNEMKQVVSEGFPEVDVFQRRIQIRNALVGSKQAPVQSPVGSASTTSYKPQEAPSPRKDRSPYRGGGSSSARKEDKGKEEKKKESGGRRKSGGGREGKSDSSSDDEKPKRTSAPQKKVDLSKISGVDALVGKTVSFERFTNSKGYVEYRLFCNDPAAHIYVNAENVTYVVKRKKDARYLQGKVRDAADVTAGADNRYKVQPGNSFTVLKVEWIDI